jgi:hypothetical protein
MVSQSYKAAKVFYIRASVKPRRHKKKRRNPRKGHAAVFAYFSVSLLGIICALRAGRGTLCRVAPGGRPTPFGACWP